jgi:hypothetical protein
LSGYAARVTSRRYAGAGRLVLAVTDAFVPENVDSYQLECGQDGAVCRCIAATGAPADLALGVADPSAVFLGGVRFSTLAAAGRVEERSQGALASADALFATEDVPYSVTPFERAGCNKWQALECCDGAVWQITISTITLPWPSPYNAWRVAREQEHSIRLPDWQTKRRKQQRDQRVAPRPSDRSR